MKENSNEEILNGIVQRITYQNFQNGYTVAILETREEELTVVGNMPYIEEGDNLSLVGNFTFHSQYGRQFAVTGFEKLFPTDTASILRYLSSGVIKGVGPATARNLVEHFGENTLEIIEKDPEALSKIKGISSEKAIAISECFKKQFGIRDVMLLLGKYKISPEDTLKVYRVLGRNSVEEIKNNPYVLCADRIGFSFEKAEDIAEDFNVPHNDFLRLKSGIEYVLKKNLSNGHTCLPYNKLCDVSSKLLEVDIDTIESVIDSMKVNFMLDSISEVNVEYIALPKYFAAERYCAARLLSMDMCEESRIAVSPKEIDYIESIMGISFDKTQREAIKGALNNSVFILTGGPGTGKTTTLKAIIELFEYREMSVVLAAPTGRAAKRITELTGRPAKTLHRLLEASQPPEESELCFCRDEQNPLECDVIIIDEVSMVDSLLLESTLRALKNSCKVIFVGDTDQLPSVSAGNVLSDLISSGCFNCIRLCKVFRQAQESAIISAAHSIIEGNLPDLTVKDSDMFYIERNNEESAVETIKLLCSQRLPEVFGFDPVGDIQVLCPSRKMMLGTANLNEVLQDCLNPKKDKSAQMYYKGFGLRVKDKVMQIKNNYDISYVRDNGDAGTGAFNGDVGIVESIDFRSDCIKVRFDDRVVTYKREELFQLEPAYAITVHKSQGSEFDCVIIPLLNLPSKLCYRNLLYTAVTRAKKLLILLGSKKTIAAVIENDRKTLRYTLLKLFLSGEQR